MADIQKIVNANELNQGASIVGVIKAGPDAEILKHDSDNVQADITDIETLYSDRFDDYGLRRKTVQIGDWNMDTADSVSVAHGLSGDTWQRVRSVNVVVRNDTDNTYYDDSLEDSDLSVNLIDGTNIILDRLIGGIFDNANFDAVSYNRGWITIWYE